MTVVADRDVTLPAFPDADNGEEDDKKLGFLNECIYGCNLLAEAALMQFHPLDGGAMLCTEGPVAIDVRGERARPFRALGTTRSVKAALKPPVSGTWKIIAADGRPLTPSPPADGWRWFDLPPGGPCRLEFEP